MKTSLTIILAIFLSSAVVSQEKFKFGSISDEQVSSTMTDIYPEAPAVVLYEELDTRYTFLNLNGLCIINRYVVRIKILTNDGLDYANQSIYSHLGKNRESSDMISGLTGYTYNWVNNKVEKTKLSKDNIFTEKVSEFQSLTKFTFPSVKPGSVIEYKYELVSPMYNVLKDFQFQRSIPVKYSKYFLQIPDYFIFSKEIKGFEYINLTQTQSNETFLVNGGGNISTSCNNLLFEANNLPALKDEEFLWNISDFVSKVTLELKSIQIPGSIYKNFTTTWKSVDEELLNYNDFGKQLKYKLFKDELLSVITPDMDTLKKIRKIYNLVKSRVKWNEINTMWIKDPKEALKKGLGTSGEINGILICALKEAGFDAYPVVMSLRSHGRIPLTHPTMDYFNYFIVGVETKNQKIYLDASAKFGDLNVIPTSSMSDYARSVRENNLSDWVDLTHICNSSDNIYITMKFEKDGSLSGEFTETFVGESRYSMRLKYESAKNEKDYIEKIETDNNFRISDFNIKGMDNDSESTVVNYKFTMNESGISADRIYVNPILFPIFKVNPFNAEFRKLPVEFSYPVTTVINTLIALPEGYMIEEGPSSKKFTLKNTDATYSYLIGFNTAINSINTRVKFDLNKIIYSHLEYPQLREFFTQLTNSSNSQIILKKIAK